MKINFIDPALNERQGHHFDWCLKIVEFLHRTGGHEVRIFVHKNISTSARTVLELYGEVIPLFLEKPYTDADTIDPLSGSLTLYFDNSLMLAEALKSISQDSVWIWPTLFDYQLNAIALSKIRCRILACIHRAPEYKSALAPILWRDAAIRAHKANLNIKFGVTFNELVPRFMPILKQNISVLPLLVDANPAASEKVSLKRIGFFGDQSPRKGLNLLPELIKHLCKQGYEVVVHDSKGKISGNKTDRLKVLGYVENIAEEIAKCDLVILPYDPAVYKHMASAIAWESVARGVPIIAPAHTAPGNFVANLNVGVTFESFDVNSILDAVARANREYKVIALGAFKASKDWAIHNGTDKFVDAMQLSTMSDESL